MHKVILAEALLNASIALFMIRVLPYSLWKRWLGVKKDVIDLPESLEAPNSDSRPTLYRIAWAHRILAQRLDTVFTCLMLAFSARAMLHRRGHESVLVLGVSRDRKVDRKPLQAHAWVVYNGVDVAGGGKFTEHRAVAAYAHSNSNSANKRIGELKSNARTSL